MLGDFNWSLSVDECRACKSRGKVWYINDQPHKLCRNHLKLVRDVHGSNVKKLPSILRGPSPLRKIAQAMAAPIRAQLDYSAIRKLFEVENPK